MKSAWMLVAGLSFALMGVATRQAMQWFSDAELVFYRSLFGFLLIAAPVLWRFRGEGGAHLVGQHLRLHLSRGLVGFTALATFFYALAHLPMSLAFTLNYASPLFLALLMPWQLGERPRSAQYVAVALGFAGVVLLLQPWQAGGEDLWAGAVGLFSGVMAAFAYIHVRKLGRLHEPEWRTVFWFAAVSLLCSGIWASLRGWNPLPQESLPWLFLLGLFATFGQLAMTRAYRTGKTAVVASFAFSAVLFSTLLDRLIFAQQLTAWALTGIVLVVMAGIGAAQLSLGERS